MSSTPLVVGSKRGGQIERFADADRMTFTVATGQTVTGGQLVEFVTPGDRKVQPAGAGSVVVAGVAMHNAAAGESVTVAGEGVWEVTASGAIGAGASVIAGAAGVVVAAGATPDARTVIGFATQDAANATLCKVRLGGRLG